MSPNNVTKKHYKVDDYIGPVMDAIDNEKLVKKTGDSIILPSEFEGYTSNFGISIMQNGLLTAVVDYSGNDNKSSNNDNAKDKKFKSNMMDLIFDILKNEFKDDNGKDYKSLTEMVRPNKNDKLLMDKVINITTALKLVGRLYEKSNDDDENSNE